MTNISFCFWFFNETEDPFSPVYHRKKYSSWRGNKRKKEKRKEVLVSFKFYFFDVMRVAQVLLLLLLKKEEEEEKPCVIAHKPLLAVIKLYSVVRGRLGVKMQPTYGSTRQICRVDTDREELCCHLSLCYLATKKRIKLRPRSVRFLSQKKKNSLKNEIYI